jgi:hypothetical protein
MCGFCVKTKNLKILVLLFGSLMAFSACSSSLSDATFEDTIDPNFESIVSYSGEPGLPGESFDFARSHWGDSIDEVISQYSGGSFFLYTAEELYGLPVEAIHSFAPNGEGVSVLEQGNYKFVGQYVKENGADIFEKLLAELTDKYGQPSLLMCFDENGNGYDSVGDMVSVLDDENMKGKAQAIWRYSETIYTSVVLDGSFKEEDSVALVIAAPR